MQKQTSTRWLGDEEGSIPPNNESLIEYFSSLTLVVCVHCAQELTEIKADLLDIKDLLYRQRVVAYENSETIDTKSKQVARLEDEVGVLCTMIEDLQLQLTKSRSPPEEQSNPSEVQNSSIDLNFLTNPNAYI